MNQDLRQQILVSLRSEGIGEADKAREAIARIEEQMRTVSKSFGDGNETAEEFRKTITNLGTSWNFFNGLLKESEAQIEAVDVGLHKLQVSAIKFADAYEASMNRAADAAEALAIKEAERQSKLVSDYERSQARRDAVAEAAELKEAERQAKLVSDYERDQARRDAIAEATEIKEAERQAKLVSDYERSQARKDAIAEADELKEAERLARLAAQHEQFLERESAAEASARASLNMQRRDSLDAAMRVAQDEALKTQRILTGFGTAVDHSHDKANKFGYAMLNVAHAFQDLQYGIGAVLNNIPLIITSFGFGPGVAGAVMAAGVAVESLRGQVGDLGVAMGLADDPTKKLGASIEDVKAKISTIEGKTFKFAVDYKDLEEAEQRLERLQKLKALIDGTKDTDAEKSLSKIAQDITTDKAGGSDALQKAVGDIEATRGIDHASPTDVNTVRNTQKHIDTLTKRRETENWFTRIGTDAIIWDMTRRRDAAQQNINRARGGFVNEEVGKFLAGDPDAIKRMKGRVQDFPGAFTPQGGNAILAMPGSVEEAQRAADQKAGLDQAAGLDADNKKAFDEWKREDDKRKTKANADQKRAANEREQEVARTANQFARQYEGRSGPGQLADALVSRIAAGQSDDEIVREVAPQVKTDIGDNVKADIASDVADRVVTDVLGHIRAQSAAAGGIDALAAERATKFGRQQRQAAARAGREQEDDAEAMLADQISSMTGGELNPQAAGAAAHRAIESMKRGVDYQRATMEAILHVVSQVGNMNEQMIGEMIQIQHQTMGMSRQLQRQAAQVRRQRAQRPSLLPFFPQ